MSWRYAGLAVGIIWSSRMCSGRLAPRRVRPAPELHAAPAARGRPVNSGEVPDRSTALPTTAGGVPSGARHRANDRDGQELSAAPLSVAPLPAADGEVTVTRRRAALPDDRVTAIMEPVVDDPKLRDPIDEVRAALETFPRPASSPRVSVAPRPVTPTPVTTSSPSIGATYVAPTRPETPPPVPPPPPVSDDDGGDDGEEPPRRPGAAGAGDAGWLRPSSPPSSCRS